MDDNRLLFKVSYTRNLEKYFKTSILFCKYDTPIRDVKPSILTIPLISELITLAWATGAELRVPFIDTHFHNGLTAVKETMKGWYPTLPFSGTVISEKIETNNLKGTNYGLLYGMGVDSLTALLRNREKNPILIRIRGTLEDRINDNQTWSLLQGKIGPFTRDEGLEMSVIETNMSEMINMRTLDRDFGRVLGSRGKNRNEWWARIFYAIAMLGVCAPLTVTKMIGTLLFASDGFGKGKGKMEPYSDHQATHPSVDEKVSWGNVRVIHESFDLTRQEKIGTTLAPHLKGSKQDVPLRVCWITERNSVEERLAKGILNCGKCEKCRLTILGLLLEGLDPSKYSFDMSSFSARDVQADLRHKKIKFDRTLVFLWKDLQKAIGKQIDDGARTDSYDSNDFFEWLKSYDLNQNLIVEKAPSRLARVVTKYVPSRRK